VELTQEHLQDIIYYDKESGLCYWLKRLANRINIGDIVGSVHCRGYIETNIYGKRYLLHHLIWFYVTGEWPKNQIDHENRIRKDNHWLNLRIANQNKNEYNKGKRKNNTSGFIGVHLRNDTNKYAAQICEDNHTVSLGSFPCPTLAAIAYDKAVLQRNKDFAVTNFPKETYELCLIN